MLRIFFINQPICDYGQSLIYHGLRNLGHFILTYERGPFNFTKLINCNEECHLSTSPCKTLKEDWGCKEHPAHLTFSKQISFSSLDNIDLIITNNGTGNEHLHRRLHKELNKPIAVLDLGDSSNSSLEAWERVFDGQTPKFFFRREYIKGQYGHPLSYSFYKDKVNFNSKQELDVSCLYRPTNRLRGEIVEKISKIFKNSFVGQKPHEEYLKTISNSKFSIALPGAGEDTLRHWEIPSQGSILCKLKQNIFIENDFIDGESCIVFSSVEELLEKINFYLGNEDEFLRLRKNCYKHFLKFHTTEERAKQLLKMCNFNQ